MVLALAAALTAAGCGWLAPHRVPIQQGNVVTQDMIDQLQPGMTRRQVAFVLGEPVLRNDFEPDRWDYVYSIYGADRELRIRRISLFFRDEALSHFAGDLAPSDIVETPDLEEWDPELPDVSPGPGPYPGPGPAPGPTPGPPPAPSPGGEPTPGGEPGPGPRI